MGFWPKLFAKTQYDGNDDATDIEDPVAFKSKVKRYTRADEDVGEDEDERTSTTRTPARTRT